MDDTTLAPCPCGVPATWYLVDLTLRPSQALAIHELTASELFEDLCDACFKRVVPAEERRAWVRVSGVVEMMRPQGNGEASYE